MASSALFPLAESFSHNGWAIRYTTMPCPDSPDNWVVFVHGTPWSSDVFQPLAKALHAMGNYNILLYDLPGYGQSQQWTAPDSHSSEPDASVKAQGQALASLLNHLALSGTQKRPRVIAHDIAGVISLRAHLLHGCEYESLALLDTNCVLPWGDKLYNLVRSSPEVFEEMPQGIFEGALRAIIRSARARTDLGLAGDGWEDILARPWIDSIEGQREVGRTSSRLSPQVSFVRQIKQADDTHTSELLEQGLYGAVRCPVKILWGKEDHWIPREKMEKLAALLGDNLKTFVTVPGAGHLIMLDQPERIAVEICRWIEFGQ
ncbi:Alpha/Beta hydrolase protein [Microdochium trichocladiopsis]|uniref:Alpha/Beta hydrolase protein n=1 Tax=Microdochium trichocladiopsis TaxID=1682393 RepID=A0A9P8YFM1_9PEZI|nr:Alpha/Beta hydrolase protein [Microdochium trichocladiopsis]KAH7037028.1 Alpha/Beta hydrolase protein [Microdochium trichocladiopsis]